MSDTFDNVFGRARNDLAAVDEPAAVATAPQEADDTGPAPDVDLTDAESADDADTEAVDVDDDAEPDEVDEATGSTEVTVVPVTVEPGDLPAESGDAAAETSDAEAEQADPAAVANAVEAEAVDAEAVDAVEAEQVAAVEARPAAGTRGNTTVADGVVSRVVTMVAGEVDGVHRLDDEDSSVTVDGDVATVRIALVIEYGHPVRALAEQLRIAVIDAVERFLGLDVAGVDVHVSDIHYPESA